MRNVVSYIDSGSVDLCIASAYELLGENYFLLYWVIDMCSVCVC